MSERTILSEKLEDNKAAAEWGIKQAELIPASNEPSAVLARAFGECREGHIPRCSAALQA